MLEAIRSFSHETHSSVWHHAHATTVSSHPTAHHSIPHSAHHRVHASVSHHWVHHSSSVSSRVAVQTYIDAKTEFPQERTSSASLASEILTCDAYLTCVHDVPVCERWFEKESQGIKIVTKRQREQLAETHR